MMMSSTILGGLPNNDKSNNEKPAHSKPVFVTHVVSFVSRIKLERKWKWKCDNKQQEMKKVIHGVKVGIALVLVSLLYLLDPLFHQVGENAMWAIMTVVVVFEYFAGATLRKGINRGIGTILGGGLGCLAAILADEAEGKLGNALIVCSSIFIFGAAAAYLRLDPKIKKKYDYAVMIFILTFNLVVVSGVRADKVLDLARERLSTIGMGFAVCIFTSLLVFPMWASDELHYLTASKFEKLATSVGSLEEYFKLGCEKENHPSFNVGASKTILESKSNDESLANFAKWEPWHGRFGFSYPWEKYLEIGDILRELAASLLSLNGCLQSSKQASSMLGQAIKEPCEITILTLEWILSELGESIKKMKKCGANVLIIPKLQSIKSQLSQMQSSTKEQIPENDENVAMASFAFLLNKAVDKVEILAKKVDELGEIADFQSKTLDV